MHIWELPWSNPANPRPNGFREVMLRLEVRPEHPGAGARCPPEMVEAWEELRMYGYAIAFSSEPDTPRQLALATKQRIRRRNVWKRLLKRYPLFLADFYREQVLRHPEHYGTYVEGEVADVQFVPSTMGYLRQRGVRGSPNRPARAASIVGMGSVDGHAPLAPASEATGATHD